MEQSPVISRDKSTAATNVPVAAVPNEPPVSLVANGPASPAGPAYAQGAAIGPNVGIPFHTEGLYFPPHYCFLPPDQTGVTAAVPADPSAGQVPPAAAVKGAGIAFPQRFCLAPQAHGAGGTGSAPNLVAQAPPAASATGPAVQRPPVVPAAPVAKAAVRRRKQRSTAAGRHARKKPVAASSGSKSRGGRKSASVDTTAMSSSDSSSVSSSPPEAVTTVGSSREEEAKPVAKKDLLKLMHTSNLPQPLPEGEARRKRLVTTLMGVAVLVAALAATACLLALLKDNWKHGAPTDGDEETNANSTIPEPQSGLGSLEGVANKSLAEYDMLPNEYGPLQHS
ncbi:mucin-1-like [Rhipicephalus sanguineus]|uniref:mucin-1-like n=1 Tax=Rhipicephalus sanguineus TaxID=34632 RepID=UPI0018934711|nr:mucin-1-like [Rhipicephalus sanguineus]